MPPTLHDATTYYEEFGRFEAAQRTGPGLVTFDRRYLHWQNVRTGNATLFEREADRFYKPGKYVQMTD